MSAQGPSTGSFGHFYNFAPPDKIETRDYGVTRYGMEVMRLADVLDKHLATRTYLVGEEYTVADIMCFPWYYCLSTYVPPHGVKIFDYLGMEKYTHLNAWVARIIARPAVQRGLKVCQISKGLKPWETDTDNTEEKKST